MPSFASCWEESKLEHHANMAARANKFRKNFEKTWSLLLRPSFYVKLLTFVIPVFRQRFVAERNTVRNELKKIIGEYVPQIRIALVQWEDGFNQWETENRRTRISGSRNAYDKEREGQENATRLSNEMLEKIDIISNYSWHFHWVESPAEMTENPWPGCLSSERARNYCDYLVQKFS